MLPVLFLDDSILYFDDFGLESPDNSIDHSGGELVMYIDDNRNISFIHLSTTIEVLPYICELDHGVYTLDLNHFNAYQYLSQSF